MPLAELDGNAPQQTAAPAGTRVWKRPDASRGGGSASKPRKREKSVPPGAMQLSLLKCQAAQAKMIIAHQRRKYQEAMDALEMAEEEDATATAGPRSRTEELAAEIAELQARKEAALRGDPSAGDDDEDDDDDDEDDEDEPTETDAATSRRGSLPSRPMTPSRPKKAPVAVAVAVSPPQIAQEELPPLARRQPWDISIAEPVVFDALLRHQDRAFRKHLELGAGAFKRGEEDPRPRRPAPPAPPKSESPMPKQAVGNPGFVLDAIKSGLGDLAPILFDNFASQPNAPPAATAASLRPARRVDPYAEVHRSGAVDSHDLDIWDPHRTDIDHLEAQLTADADAS